MIKTALAIVGACFIANQIYSAGKKYAINNASLAELRAAIALKEGK